MATQKEPLSVTHPELAAQADGWDPTKVTAGSDKKCLWRCQFGHNWEAAVVTRSAGSGCPYCSGYKPIVGQTDLATTNPALAAQAHGWDPTTISAGSKKKVSWKCELGHSYMSSLVNRSRGNGCPVCSGHQVLAAYNDLATTHPDLASQADGWDPTTLNAGSNKSVGWKCEKGHIWAAAVKDRSSGNGCPTCSNKKVLAGYNDLATTHPDLASQADGWDPTTIPAGAGKMVFWKCELGHSWNETLNGRSSGHGCPVCSGHRVLAGYNDLATTRPELAAQADGWDPTKVTAGSDKKCLWRCQFGHNWEATVVNRSKGRGCPSCASTGFDPNKEGWLYFIDHDALQMFQVGISNSPVTRLGQHSKRGWEIIEVRGPIEGHLAQQLELAILHAVERRGALLGHKAEIEKFDGYSEAWTKDSLPVTSFKQLLDWVYEDDKNIVQ